MSTKAARRLLLVALAAGSLLLAGCESAAGQQGGSTGSGGCDPSGMPGINGCDNGADQDEPATADPQPPDPGGEGGWPRSCPQDITVTYDPDTGDVSRVEVITYDGTDEQPTNVQATPRRVSRDCLDDLNQENHQFTEWINDELDERSGR